MKIILNGEMSEVSDGVHLSELIEKLGLDGPVAAMVNDVVIQREKLASRRLQPGDRVELLRMMGGG
ncbi:MAG: sulfur carrier protein ThiS [Nitrospinota bacterium]|nr:sulfur carrier protein ThiS [Nitrospinota bacterium]